MSDMAKNLILWVVIAIVLMSVFSNFGPSQVNSQAMPYSEFIAEVKSGVVDRVVIEGRVIHGVTQGGDSFVTYSPGDPGLVGDLLDYGVQINARPQEQQGLLAQIFISWFPMLLLIGVWGLRRRRRSGGGASRFGR